MKHAQSCDKRIYLTYGLGVVVYYFDCLSQSCLLQNSLPANTFADGRYQKGAYDTANNNNGWRNPSTTFADDLSNIF
jgi:hypothetical protein